MTYEEQIKKWKAAMEKAVKKARAEKHGMRKLLVRAGIVERDGKRLAKHYR
ncbi:MAG TPA: hypothetical protein VFE47_30080 [Tepidisphaeraceae bacterium]|nr:hypothetical protein [Tepidisphaeraceae bacterium]